MQDGGDGRRHSCLALRNDKDMSGCLGTVCLLGLLSECAPKGPAADMGCSTKGALVVIGAVCSRSKPTEHHATCRRRLSGRDCHDQHGIIAVASGPR
jgi:hypothetical protein